MFKSYTKPPVSQSCWLLLVLAWEEIQSGLSARTNNLRHSASRFSCHPPSSQNDSDPSCAESWMRLQALNHFDSPPSPEMITDRKQTWLRETQAQFIKESHFSAQPTWKRIVWFCRVTNPSVASWGTYLSSWVSFLRLGEGGFGKLYLLPKGNGSLEMGPVPWWSSSPMAPVIF